MSFPDLQFVFEDRIVPARPGQSVAAALIAVGERCLRIDEFGNPKGVVCGIGVCWECRCEIDGNSNVRACLTPVTANMRVRRQTGMGQCPAPF